MDNLIKTTDLTKHYGGFSLDHLSFTLPAGCVTGLVGSNGAGKTTTIKALMGLISLDGGTIELFDHPFDTHSPSKETVRAKSRIGFVFDSCDIVGDLQVRDAGSITRVSYRTYDDDCFEKYCALFSLDPKKKIKDLSRGMSMKLQIACALAHEPDLLILDEVTSGLDPLARNEVLDILRDYMLTENRGILISSHITSDLEKIADTIICLDKGRLIFDLPKDQITDTAGIAHCGSLDFEIMLSSGFFEPETLRFIQNPYEITVLVEDRYRFMQHFPSISCEKSSIDDYLNLILKGELK